MMLKKLLLTILPSIMFSSCTLTDKKILPKELREVSGITAINDFTIAMIQDEDGILYFYDLNENKVTQKVRFNKEGDYEDIEKVGHYLYVLKSNGEIDKISLEGELIETFIPQHLSEENDTEGLCYSKENNALFILCKEGSGDGLSKHEKAIYTFNLDNDSYSTKPKFVIDRSKFLDKKQRKKFKPSGLVINELSEVIIIDSKSSLIGVFDEEGNCKRIEGLDLPQPEGICIMPSGHIWIASEGGKNGFLAKLNW